MIEIDIPGFRTLRLSHLVADYNGTLAVDGMLLPGVAEALTQLASDVRIHVVTADTFGMAGAQLAGLPVHLTIIPGTSQAAAKGAFVASLGGNTVVAIGNGRNDGEMLAAAALGIALIQQEGAAGATLAKADVVCSSAMDALELLRNPKRLVATLRS